MAPQTVRPHANPGQADRKRTGRLSAMTLVVLALNLGGWGIFAFAIAPHHFQFKGLGLGLGVALTAWTLGARHAFDADHIYSAIDNAARKLMADGRQAAGHRVLLSPWATPPSSWSSAPGWPSPPARSSAPWSTRTPAIETLGGIVGTSLAATFLYLIAALNLVVLAGVLEVFRGMRQGLYDEDELERQLQARGLMWRFFGRFMRAHHQDLAHVLRRGRLRDRLRHRHRGPPARRHRPPPRACPGTRCCPCRCCSPEG